MKLIAKGSEAEVYFDGRMIIKYRRPRKYRHKLIDENLRRYRTRREAKILRKAWNLGINVPFVYSVNEDEFKIYMQYIEGKALTIENFHKYIKEIALIVKRLHENSIIHGDLHPKNFILSKEGRIFIIDFGLSFISHRIEDKAVDLVEIKKLLKDKWEEFEKYYQIEEVLEKVKEIEGRGRYK